jgi:hypothetical protein
MKQLLILAAAGLAAARLSAAEVDWSKLPPASTQTGVTFDQDIAPILKTSCVRCHGAERPRAQLRLDSLDGVMKGTKQGAILTAGDSAHSLLVKAVSRLDPETAMPPKPRGPRGPRPMGTNAPAMQPPGGPDAGGPPHAEGEPPSGPPPMGGPGGPPPGGEGTPRGTNAPQTRLRPLGPPPTPLTAEQVGLIRAWIDQGAK